MPYMMRVMATRLWVEGADAEEAELAIEWIEQFRDDDIAAGDLDRTLKSFADDLPSTRLALVAEGEERELILYLAEKGDVGVHEITVSKRKWSIDDRPDLTELVAAMKDGGDEIFGAPEKKKLSSEAQALASALEEAKRAIDEHDVAAMLRVLDAPAMASNAAASARANLYRTLVAKKCPEAADLFFRALREDTRECAHAVYYRLYVQKHLASRVLDELVRAIADRPRTDYYVARLVSAIAEWPDFSTPEGLDPSVRELLPGAPPKPKKKRAEVLEETLAGLEEGRVVAARRAWRTCVAADKAQKGKLIEQFSDRLRAVAGGSGAPLFRGLALDYLRTLGLDLSTLVDLTKGLPAVTGIREIHGAPNDAPIVKTVPWTPPRPKFDWREFGGAAEYADGWLLRNSQGLLSFEGDNAWRSTKAPSGQPIRVLDDESKNPFVFIDSPLGLVALDRKTGKEAWTTRTVTLASARGSIITPQPLIWIDGARLWLCGSDHLYGLDARTGAIESVTEIPFPNPTGFARTPKGEVIILDGSIPFAMGDSDDVIPSGLVVNGLEDRVLSRTLFDVTRGPRISLSSVDVVVDGTRYRLPEGRLVATRGRAIQMRALDDFVHGNGAWHEIILSSDSAQGSR